MEFHPPAEMVRAFPDGHDVGDAVARHAEEHPAVDHRLDAVQRVVRDVPPSVEEMQPRIFILTVEERHIGRRNMEEHISGLNHEAALPFRHVQSASHPLPFRRRRPQFLSAFKPAESCFEVRLFYRFEQIVDTVDLEGPDGILIVCRGENITGMSVSHTSNTSKHRPSASLMSAIIMSAAP